jgi:hypothetical protein
MHTFYSEGDFEKNIQHPLSSLQGFTTSFADGYSEKLNTQIYFDMDSVFFVCDNSTSGQFCNDICKIIPDLLHQTNKSLTTANGTGPCLQEGTVRLQSLDDDITQHTFILNNCLFNPDSPVNLLLTRRLAEKFIDANRNPDEQTRIESRYSTHVLAWAFGNFQKTFLKPISGFPELLFDEGFWAYTSFCRQVLSYATNDDAPHYSNIIPFDDDEIQPGIDEGDDEENNMLFIINKTVIFKDGKRITQEVTYLGPV